MSTMRQATSLLAAFSTFASFSQAAIINPQLIARDSVKSFDCGNKDQSKLSQRTFQGDTSSPVFGDFCKDWSKDKKSSKTIFSGAEQIDLDFSPSDGGKECIQNCEDAYTQLAIACAAGNGDGNVYTKGSADYGCGTFSFNVKDLGPANPYTFYFGSLSGDRQGGNTGAGPVQQDVCNYVAYQDGSDICNAGNVTPNDNTGGCPGQNLKYPNFCGGVPGLKGLPTNYQLKSDDDCGAAGQDKNDNDPSHQVKDGTHYADVIDTLQGNRKIGECVYEYGGEGYCSIVVQSTVSEHFITCRLGADYD